MSDGEEKSPTTEEDVYQQEDQDFDDNEAQTSVAA